MIRKGAPTKFKPKPRAAFARASSLASSADPGVERQSQTPVPVVSQAETSSGVSEPIDIEETAEYISRTIEPTPREQPSLESPPITSASSNSRLPADSGRDSLKRKTVIVVDELPDGPEYEQPPSKARKLPALEQVVTTPTQARSKIIIQSASTPSSTPDQPQKTLSNLSPAHSTKPQITSIQDRSQDLLIGQNTDIVTRDEPKVLEFVDDERPVTTPSQSIEQPTAILESVGPSQTPPPRPNVLQKHTPKILLAGSFRKATSSQRTTIHTEPSTSEDSLSTQRSTLNFNQPTQNTSTPRESPAVNDNDAHSRRDDIARERSESVRESQNGDSWEMGVEEAAEVVPIADPDFDGPPGIADDAPEPVLTRAKKKRVSKPSKRKKKVQPAEGSDIRPTLEISINGPHRASRRRVRKKQDDKKKRRAKTPDGAEDDVIDHSTVTMAELCQDLRIGKKFSKHDEIKKRDVERRVKSKIARIHPELISLVEGGDGLAQTEREEGENAQLAPVSGPVMRVIDGQIVLDDNSLQLDRHKRAQAEGGDLEEVEENEFTRITTSGTYMKRERNQVWDEAATELFYKGLREFGTDFEMIANMFPYRSRRQIKLKFNREERIDPDAVTRALTGVKDEIDMEEYITITGMVYEEVDDIKAEQQKLEDEYAAQQTRHANQAAEFEKRKREGIQSTNAAHRNTAKRILNSTDNPGNGESSKENEPEGSVSKGKSKSRAAAKRKKNMHSTRGGGEEVEILGSIE
ncbi:hypothetical protein B7494_g5800 [Chlorociboria aeruginascens]|nr:hypothetical protein B7494_g5800 [Chlorociboria aeruginascens]